MTLRSGRKLHMIARNIESFYFYAQCRKSRLQKCSCGALLTKGQGPITVIANGCAKCRKT